jgi:hypothetical protein
MKMFYDHWTSFLTPSTNNNHITRWIIWDPVIAEVFSVKVSVPENELSQTVMK